MPRCAKSFQRTVLMLPSGFIANDPPPGPLCPVSVFAETAPSTVAMNEGLGVVVPAPPALQAPSRTSGYHLPNHRRPRHECGGSSSRAPAATLRCRCLETLMVHRPALGFQDRRAA